MQEFFKPILNITKSRKFYIALSGAVVTYLTAKYGASNELTLLTGVLTALGVYSINNEGGK